LLSGELFKHHGMRVSDKTVAKLLREHGYTSKRPISPLRARSTLTATRSSSISMAAPRERRSP